MRLLQETFNKDDKETERIIDEQEIATESLIESSITEENKLHYELEIEVRVINSQDNLTCNCHFK